MLTDEKRARLAEIGAEMDRARAKPVTPEDIAEALSLPLLTPIPTRKGETIAILVHRKPAPAPATPTPES